MIDLGSRAWPFEHNASPGVNKLWVYNINWFTKGILADKKGFTKGILTDAQNNQDGSQPHGGRLKDAAERK